MQFDFTKEAADKMKEIRKRIDAGSNAEVVRRAMSLLDYATGEAAQGSKVVIRRPDGDEHVVLVK